MSKKTWTVNASLSGGQYVGYFDAASGKAAIKKASDRVSTWLDAGNVGRHYEQQREAKEKAR